MDGAWIARDAEAARSRHAKLLLEPDRRYLTEAGQDHSGTKNVQGEEAAQRHDSCSGICTAVSRVPSARARHRGIMLLQRRRHDMRRLAPVPGSEGPAEVVQDHRNWRSRMRLSPGGATRQNEPERNVSEGRRARGGETRNSARRPVGHEVVVEQEARPAHGPNAVCARQHPQERAVDDAPL